MYNGKDRVRQINALNQLAEEIFCSLPDEVRAKDITPKEVKRWLRLSSDPRDHQLPDWFDKHDLSYLTNKIKSKF